MLLASGCQRRGSEPPSERLNGKRSGDEVSVGEHGVEGKQVRDKTQEVSCRLQVRVCVVISHENDAYENPTHETNLSSSAIFWFKMQGEPEKCL